SRRDERSGPWLRLRIVDLNRPFLDDDVPAARRKRHLIERQRLVEPDLNIGEADRVEHAGELRGDTLQPGLRTGPFSLHPFPQTADNQLTGRLQQHPVLRRRTLVVTDPVAETANPAGEVVPRLLHALPQTVDDRL